MNLYVDIGNSRIKWARDNDGDLQAPGAMVLADTPDWAQRLPLDGVTRVVVASVADAVPLAVLQAEATIHGIAVHVARTTSRVGDVINAYADPRAHGIDRWMACLAAHSMGQGSVLVADAGTATTLDWVDADGRHGGGLIAPGLAVMRTSLRANTQLRPGKVHLQSGWLARDPESAITIGTLRSTVALLDSAVAEFAPDRLLITGGDAQVLAPYLTDEWEVMPLLVLEGLSYYAKHTLNNG